MPNKENINKIINTIRVMPNQFLMHEWTVQTECGTAHCVGGWVDAFIHAEKSNDLPWEWLGVSSLTADELFYMRPMCGNIDYPPSMFDFDELDQNVKIAIAINVLETLRDTGEVTWSKWWNGEDSKWKAKKARRLLIDGS